MPDYRQMYLKLFDATERAIEELQKDNASSSEKATKFLILAQQECENIYVETDI